MRGRWSKWLLILAMPLAGCLDTYDPPVGEEDVNILAVDGFLDTSEGVATVTLTRAVSLASSAKPPAETNAQVTLLDNQGTAYPLQEADAGQYSVTGVTVDSEAQYRIHIRTQSGNEYQSDLMGIYPTPPIDSVTWVTDDENLTIRVNTHDFSNRTKNFRWTFEETWNYHAAVLSQFKVVDGQYFAREANEMMFYCWNTQPSTSIVIGSSNRLSENIISQAPVQHIPKGSVKLSMKYSIQVIQRGISDEEYNYLEQLKKTTESVGGLFDPQPSQVPGNIRRMDSASPLAIGFFGVGNTVRERIFIAYTDLPRYFQLINPIPGCSPPDTVCIGGGGSIKICTLNARDLTEAHILGEAIYSGISLIGITLTTARCADCRTAGGVLEKPPFWQ